MVTALNFAPFWGYYCKAVPNMQGTPPQKKKDHHFEKKPEGDIKRSKPDPKP